MSNAAKWSRAHGGYGRPAKMLRNGEFREVAIMVTLPKVYFEEYGDRYLVTDRRNVAYADKIETAYFAKRADAVAYAEATYL